MPERPMAAQAQVRVALEPVHMPRFRLASALGNWVPAAMLVALAVASSLWLAELGQPPGEVKRFTGRAPDLTMREFEVTSMGEDGKPLRRLSAAYMAHFRDTDTKELTQPHLVLFREGEEAWNIASERGWVSADNEVLMLLGQVNIWRDSPDGKRAITIETEDLRVFPREDYAETELPVRISTPESFTRGTGMRAYLGDSRVQLLSKVKTIINPIVR